MPLSRLANPALLNFALALGLLYVFRSVLWPFALAFVIVILTDALARKIEALLPRASRWIIFLITAILLSALAFGTLLIVFEGAAQLLTQAPFMAERLSELGGMIRLPGGEQLDVAGLMKSIAIAPLVRWVAASVQSTASGLGLTALYLFFLLISRRMVEKRLRQVIAKKGPEIGKVLERTVIGVQGYMYVQAVTGLMLAIASGVAMFAVGLDNALFWALALFLLSFIPVVGVMVGSLAPSLFALLQFDTPVPALIVFGVIQVAAAIIGNIVLPKMQAEAQNIDPAASMLALGAWSLIWGIPGAFLAIPLTLAVMYALAHHPSLDWVAVLLSNDGDPLSEVREAEASRQLDAS